MWVLLQLTDTSTGAVEAPTISFSVDGRSVRVADDGSSLLEVLREQLRITSVKDGCSPQGQCGCCTVWVDGAPRVACVTPARRVDGRAVTTFDGLPPELRSTWVRAFVDTGASQCGFCTPGIVMRLAALAERRAVVDTAQVRSALAAHLCRCTGWTPILEAAQRVRDGEPGVPGRDFALAERRAAIEGGVEQSVGEQVVAGRGGFADDTAPPDALVAVPDGTGGWMVADTLRAARSGSGKVQGRNSTLAARHPLDVPSGDYVFTLRTSFVEPAYLEPDASWCAPGGDAATPLANGGAFGAKQSSPVVAAARDLAAAQRRPVRALLAREDTVRLGPKRPPVAAGIRADGTGVIRVARTPGSPDLGAWRMAVALAHPGLEIQEVAVPGPPVSAEIRAAGWAEAIVLKTAWEAWFEGDVRIGRPVTLRSPEGAVVTAVVGLDRVEVTVSAGDVLDLVVLRSYVMGAVHQALGWVRREAIAVDDAGRVVDLTVRSFGVIPARDMPDVDVVVKDASGPPVRAGDAVFAAVAAAAWLSAGLPDVWPVERGGLR